MRCDLPGTGWLCNIIRKPGKPLLEQQQQPRRILEHFFCFSLSCTTFGWALYHDMSPRRPREGIGIPGCKAWHYFVWIGTSWLRQREELAGSRVCLHKRIRTAGYPGSTKGVYGEDSPWRHYSPREDWEAWICS